MNDVIDVEVVRDGTNAVVPAQRAVEPRGPQPIKRDYHTSMRYGLQMVNLWLESHGFTCNCIEQSSVSLSVEKKGFMFDIKIWPLKTSNIVFVTSYEGYVYDPEKVNAKVVRLKDELPNCNYVIQVIGTRQSTLPPVYIPMHKDLTEDPGVFMARGILNTLNVMVKELAKQGRCDLQDDLKEVETLNFESLSKALDVAPVKVLPWFKGES